MTKLPFDPASVPVPELAVALEAVHNIALVHDLQEVDTRTTAAAHYERRIRDLTVASVELTDEDRACGYTVGSWYNHANFTALDGSMSTLNETRIRHHVRRRGLIQE